jgi:hypothetical protein
MMHRNPTLAAAALMMLMHGPFGLGPQEFDRRPPPPPPDPERPPSRPAEARPSRSEPRREPSVAPADQARLDAAEAKRRRRAEKRAAGRG